MTTFKESQWGTPPSPPFPRICSLVAGVFNSRPPQPRLCFIWNVQTVIDFIKSEWGQNEDLSDKYLTYKLTMLFALISASRVLGLQHLDIRFMTKGIIYYIFKVICSFYLGRVRSKNESLAGVKQKSTFIKFC